MRQEIFKHSLLSKLQEELRNVVHSALLSNSKPFQIQRGVEIFSDTIAEYAQPDGFFDIRNIGEPEVFDDPDSLCEYEEVVSDACTENNFGGKLEIEEGNEEQEAEFALKTAMTELFAPQYNELFKEEIVKHEEKEREVKRKSPSKLETEQVTCEEENTNTTKRRKGSPGP